MNLTIAGSGVFVTPAILLKATGSPGASLLLWVLGAITSISSLLVWLEFGLSIPRYYLPNREKDDSLVEGESLQSVPRSGGEKNFVSFTVSIVCLGDSNTVVLNSWNTFTDLLLCANSESLASMALPTLPWEILVATVSPSGFTCSKLLM